MVWPLPLLQRYILGELVRVFCFVLVCLTVLVNVVGVFQQATASGLGVRQVWEVLPYIVPSMLPFTIPSALLLTVCLVYGRLAGDQEVIAAKAAGISVTTLLWPALMLAGVLSGLSLVLTDQVIPWALGRIEHIVLHTMEDVFLERLRSEHRFIDRQRGMQITVADVRGKTLIRPVIRHVPKKGRTYTLQAEAATIKLDVDRQVAEIHVKHGVIDLPYGDKVLVHEQTERFSLAHEIGKPKPRNLPIAVIERQMQQAVADEQQAADRRLIDAALSLTSADFARLAMLDRHGALEPGEHTPNYHRLRTEIHSRYALSCSCLFFVLLGGPFAILRAKSQFLTSFLYCFTPIVGAYYPIIMGLMARAKRGDIDPTWGMWLGNALLLIVAAVMLRRVLRH